MKLEMQSSHHAPTIATCQQRLWLTVQCTLYKHRLCCPRLIVHAELFRAIE